MFILVIFPNLSDFSMYHVLIWPPFSLNVLLTKPQVLPQLTVNTMELLSASPYLPVLVSVLNSLPLIISLTLFSQHLLFVWHVHHNSKYLSSLQQHSIISAETKTAFEGCQSMSKLHTLLALASFRYDIATSHTFSHFRL